MQPRRGAISGSQSMREAALRCRLSLSPSKHFQAPPHRSTKELVNELEELERVAVQKGLKFTGPSSRWKSERECEKP